MKYFYCAENFLLFSGERVKVNSLKVLINPVAVGFCPQTGSRVSRFKNEPCGAGGEVVEAIVLLINVPALY